MKAVSLWQPWASAIALAAKRIETRGWATSYRGPLAIHAAKRCIKSELRAYGNMPIWKGALDLGNPLDKPLWETLPFGAIVAVARLEQCYPTHAITEYLLHESHKRPWDGDGWCAWTEYSMGDFGPGRFGWILADVQALPKPIPFRGAQGFFDVPDSILEAA